MRCVGDICARLISNIVIDNIAAVVEFGTFGPDAVVEHYSDE